MNHTTKGENEPLGECDFFTLLINAGKWITKY